MNNSTILTEESQTEAIKFLERDFNQCFAQMRTYDNQIWEICKFTFTVYTAILGIAIGLHQYSIEHSIDLIPVAAVITAVGFLLGVFMLFLTVRNRMYFVIVARYVNEHRNFFLEMKPLGFKNASRMFVNSSHPPFFDWCSSQIWLSLVISTLNAGLLAVFIYFLFQESAYKWVIAGVMFIISISGQIRFTFLYLRSRENKSASTAAFGCE